MAIILDGTAGIANNATDLSYTGTLTGSTGVVNIGSGQVYKDASGNVGIGTSSPLTPLHVVGAIQSQRTGGVAQYARMVNSGGTATFVSDNQASGSYTGFDFQGLSTASGTPVTYATITGGGDLLVGTTSGSPGYGNTNTGVQISGSGSTFSRAANDYVMVVNQNTVDGSSYYQMVFRVANVTKGTIISTSTATSFNTSSDYRLKDITGPLTNSGAFIDALQPKVGSWKADGSAFVGFLAHEFQEVSPSSVTGTKDAVDADGKPVMQGMQASSPEVMANIIAELQSLRKRIAALEGTSNTTSGESA